MAGILGSKFGGPKFGYRLNLSATGPHEEEEIRHFYLRKKKKPDLLLSFGRSYISDILFVAVCVLFFMLPLNFLSELKLKMSENVVTRSVFM